MVTLYINPPTYLSPVIWFSGKLSNLYTFDHAFVLLLTSTYVLLFCATVKVASPEEFNRLAQMERFIDYKKYLGKIYWEAGLA